MARQIILTLFCSIFSLAYTAPTCEVGAFCYSPNENLRVTVARLADGVEFRLLSNDGQAEEMGLKTNGTTILALSCDLQSKSVQTSPIVPLRSQVDVIAPNGMQCSVVVKETELQQTTPLEISFSSSPDSSEAFTVSSLKPAIVPSEGLTKEQLRQFSKAHAILMILGWLFFVPTGFLFARFGKDIYRDQTIFGGAVWFQIHRASNFMGVVCICVSMLCIFISMKWTWKGTGSGSKYWTEVHTDVGIISSVLAVAQPLNSLLRCGPTHSRRPWFNWGHRLTGIVSFALALTAILVAASQFRKIWNEPLLEMVLACFPVAICFAASIVFPIIEGEKTTFGADQESLLPEEDTEQLGNGTETHFDENAKPPHLLRVPVIFFSIGMFLASAVALSLLVVNGYKSA